MSLRILHVYKTYFPETQGGLEETIRQICRATSADGFENRMLTLAPAGAPATLQRDEATVLRYRRNLEIASCGMSLPALLDYRRQATAADLVHFHFPWPFADLMHLVGRVRRPAVVTYHSDVVRQRNLLRVYRPLMRRFLRQVDTVVATSPNYRASSEVLREFADKVEVIPIGLDAASYPAADESTVAHLEYQVGRDFFLFVGVLRYYKGLHVLLDAVAGTRLPVVIAGAGPAEQELKQQAQHLGLDNVRFLGRVTDGEKVALYHLSRGVVFPACMRSEAFGVTLVEGLMYGKPLISTELGTGTSYVNADGETGLVVPPKDPEALREAMRTLAGDDALVERFGQAAYARFLDSFTAGVMGQRYGDLYRRLVPGEAD